MKTLLIGLGNMGLSLAKGILMQKSLNDIELSALDTDALRREQTAQELAIPIFADPEEGIEAAEAILLCIKPQGLNNLAEQLKKKIGKDKLIISILAGVTCQDIRACFEFAGPVVRAMPNIAAMVHCAATVLAHNDKCEEHHNKLAEKIFSTIGEVHWEKESLMDAVTGLSGSGPAYICMVIEALTDGGVKMGLSRPLALNLAIQTVSGSAKLVKETNLHPAILRDQVTTPGGTTIHAIHDLESKGLRSMLISAVATATEKSHNLRLKKKN